MNLVVDEILAWACVALAVVAIGLIWYGWHRAQPQPEPTGEEDTERMPRYMEPVSPLLVVAGTHEQYEYYCARNRLNRWHDAVYIDRPQDLGLRRGCRYTLVGTYWENVHLEEILGLLTYAGCTRV